jgi:glyoxylase-like metal-dependent hydrolase (beta-lactamase superfamily II)
MKLLYIFDDKIKPFTMTDKGICKPTETGIIGDGISSIRVYDVNLWFYTKNGVTVAFDTGHRNFSKINQQFEKIHLDPNTVKHVFLTHLDTDHAGGIDVSGRNIFPNAQVYMGAAEKRYMTGEIHRAVRAGIKIKNCVQIKDGYFPIVQNTVLDASGIKVEAISTPGHTVGHTCYIVDDKVLVTGDCLAVNETGGYAFFDFFTQDPARNKKSLRKLQKTVSGRDIQYVCTGHSGIYPFTPAIFAHIDESAVFGKDRPFHKDGPRNPFRDE